MSKFQKVVKISAAAAVGVTTFAGMQVPDASAAVGTLTLEQDNATNSILLKFTSDAGDEAIISRDGRVIQRLPAPTATTNNTYSDSLLNMKLSLGKLNQNLNVVDGLPTLDGTPITDGSTPAGMEKTIDITIPKVGLSTSDTFDYKVEDQTGTVEESSITVVHDATDMAYVISDNQEVTESEFEVVTGNTLNVPLSDMVGNYLHTYLIDPITGAKTETQTYLIGAYYQGTEMPTLVNAKPVIKVNSTKVASSIEVTIEKPAELEGTKTKIEYSTGYGNYQEYDGPFTVSTNTAIQARMNDGLGNLSETAMYQVSNIVKDFGNEYKVNTNGNTLSIEVNEGIDYLDSVEVSIGGSAWITYDTEITAENGTHKVSTRSISKDGTVSVVKETQWIVGGPTEEDIEKDKVDSEYAANLKLAEEAVSKAETSKSQTDVDTALETLKTLSVSDQLPLIDKLEVVKNHISSLGASKSIKDLKDNPNMDTLIQALLDIGKVETDNTRKTLEDSIKDEIDTILDRSTSSKIDDAIGDLINSVLMNPTEEGLYAINKLIDEVRDSSLKLEYQEDLKEIVVLVEQEDQLEDALTSVVRAERSLTMQTYETALDRTNKLSDSKAKDKLLKRLDKVLLLVEVSSVDLISDIQSNKEVSALDIANFAKMDIPSSLVEAITKTIKDMRGDANEENVLTIIELHVEYDKAVRSMIAKDINSYASLYKTAQRTTSSLDRMPDPTNLNLAYKFLTDEKVLPELIRGLEKETEAELINYFKTLAPSVVKGGETGSSILDYSKQNDLETNRTYQNVKAALLTKEALMKDKEDSRKLAKAYVETLKNGGYKQALLSSLGIEGEENEKAGGREDKTITPGSKVEDEKDKDKDKDDKDKDKDDKDKDKDDKDKEDKDKEDEDKKKEQEERAKWTSPKINGTGTLSGISEFYMDEELRDTEFSKYFEKVDKYKSQVSVDLNERKSGEELTFKLANGLTLKYKLESVSSTVAILAEEIGHQEYKFTLFIDGKPVSLPAQVESEGVYRGQPVMGNSKFLTTPVEYKYAKGVTTFSAYTDSTVKFIQGPKEFLDLQGTWANDHINFLTSRAIITDTDNFRPRENITRAEFAVWLGRTIGGVEYTDKKSFSDVNYSDAETASYIEGLAAMGVIKGDGGNFMPNDEITRQQAALMLSRILESNGFTMSGYPDFKDAESISVEARNVVGALQSLDIFTGDNGNFLPSNKLTRQQAAKVVTITTTNIGKIK